MRSDAAGRRSRRPARSARRPRATKTPSTTQLELPSWRRSRRARRCRSATRRARRTSRRPARRSVAARTRTRARSDPDPGTLERTPGARRPPGGPLLHRRNKADTVVQRPVRRFASSRAQCRSARHAHHFHAVARCGQGGRMFQNSDELLKYIKDEGVEMVDVRFCRPARHRCSTSPCRSRRSTSRSSTTASASTAPRSAASRPSTSPTWRCSRTRRRRTSTRSAPPRR